MGQADWINNFGLPILSGVVLLLIGGISTFWSQRRKSKRSTLDKTLWFAENGDGKKIAQIRFEERGSRLKAFSKHFGDSINREFECKGHRHGDKVLLTWEQKGGIDAYFGSLVFKIDSNFQKMKGYSTFVREGSHVEAQPYDFRIVD